MLFIQRNHKNMKTDENNKIKVYADTSVFGGVFDDEFSIASQKFFELIHNHTFELVVSVAVEREILSAPEHIRILYDELLPLTRKINITEKAVELQEAYLKEKILTNKWEDDALHIALATIEKCKMIVSWNFKHIVNYKKIPLYNAVNILKGYEKIEIYSPLEIINNED